MVVYGSEQLHLSYSKQTSQVLILGEGFASGLLESMTPDKNKYHLTVPALGYFWQHHPVTEFQRAVSVCGGVCVYKPVDLSKIINYMQEETRTFSIGFIRYCGQSRQFKATQNPITFILAVITPSLFTIFS